nr:MAG: hypothetical protein [Microvirus Sku14]
MARNLARLPCKGLLAPLLALPLLSSSHALLSVAMSDRRTIRYECLMLFGPEPPAERTLVKFGIFRQ